MAVKHPLLFFLIILSITIYYFKHRTKPKKFEKGSKIANVNILNENELFMKKLIFYRRITIVLKICLVVNIICIAILICRPVETKVSNIKKYNRDIMFCMDVSGSVTELDKDLVTTFKRTIDQLNGERIGITIFNTSSVVLVPLTDDYEYLNTTLDTIKESLELANTITIDKEKLYKKKYTISGTTEGINEKGASLIGDGLSSCVLNFTNLDEDKDRTRIIIFTTDNDLNGTPKLTLTEAARLSKSKNVMVFGIAPKGIFSKNVAEFKSAVEYTGGKYYNNSDSTTTEIVQSINSTSKSISNDIEARQYDIPELPFILLFITFSSIIIIDKKVIR